jgi:predicted transcriptional regulator
MSKALSLKLQDDIFEDVEKIIKAAKIPRNTYINRALDFYNKINRKRMLKKQLAKASKLVQATSLEVLKEFEALEDPIIE